MRWTRAALTLVVVAGAMTLTGSAAAARIVVSPGESIQTAIDAAEPGDTIVVRAGTYAESLLVTKDRLTLAGRGAVLEPPAADPACVDPFEPELLHGICVFGEADADGNVLDPVAGVRIGGFTIRSFSGFGIFAYGAANATFVGNVAAENDEYGIAAFSSTGTKILGNVTYGTDDAGIYVGDSPEADTLIAGNKTYDNLLGIFQRNARGVTMAGNLVHANCVGVLILADAPGPAGESRIIGNRVLDNSKACPALEEEGFPPTSGIGILLLGADDVRVSANLIEGNVPSGPTAFSGGVVVTAGIAGTPPSNVRVTRNVIRNNDPDLFWDETGTGIAFEANRCQTSVPGGLCG